MQQRPLRPEPQSCQNMDAVETKSAEAAPSPLPRFPWRRWLREPLLHFLLIGMALFLGYRALNPNPDAGAQSNRIELTENDLRQMSVAWLAQGRPAPTPEQMGHLVEQRVREEILYREALALGLDKGDTIVKRRLAQKMEFLAEDLSALREPTGSELKSWFQNNAERFALPPRISFRHLYFSPDRRGPQARTDSEQALGEIKNEPAGAPAAASLAELFHIPGRLRRSLARAASEPLRSEIRPGDLPAQARLLAGAGRVRLRLASGLDQLDHTKACARLRGNRGAGERRLD